MVVGFVCIAGIGCSRNPPPAPPAQAAEPVKVLPADFVLIVDDSASITNPLDQGFIRETLMLLADLAAPEDRLTLVPFGAGTHIGEPVEVRGDADRVRFKDAVRRALIFGEKYSDLRAAVRALTENQSRLFRPAGASVRIPIFITDGKLEPEDGDARQAIEEIRATVRGPLGKTPLYAIVTGNTGCNVELVPGLTGLSFIERDLARSGERMVHAERLDQLLDSVVQILRRAKGMSGFADAKTRFKVDSTVENLTLVVRKKSAAGARLCAADEIRLKHTAGADAPETVITFANHQTARPASVYWTDDYELFDLIVLRNPPAGAWSVELASGRPPEVVSTIDTPIELRVDVKRLLFTNESSSVRALLFDRRRGTASRQPYKVQAFLPETGVYREFTADPATGQYVLEVPAALERSPGAGHAPGTVELDIIAEARTAPGSATLDPWFVRRAPRITLTLADPIVRWDVLPRRRIAVFGRVQQNLGGTLALRAPHCPEFESTPRASVLLEKLDPKTNQVRPVLETDLGATTDQSQIVFRGAAAFPGAGTYLCRYRLAGNTRDGGPFILEGPRSTLRVVSVRIFFWSAIGVALLALLQLASARTAGLQGVINATSNRGEAGRQQLQGHRRFESGARIDKVGLGDLRFALAPHRWFFLAGKKFTVTVTAGSAQLDEGSGQKRVLRAGERATLRAGQACVLTFGRTNQGRPDGATVTVRFNVGV